MVGARLRCDHADLSLARHGVGQKFQTCPYGTAVTQGHQLLKGVMGQRFGGSEHADDSDPSQTPNRGSFRPASGVKSAALDLEVTAESARVHIVVRPPPLRSSTPPRRTSNPRMSPVTNALPILGSDVTGIIQSALIA